jgi:hypothetical protein
MSAAEQAWERSLFDALATAAQTNERASTAISHAGLREQAADAHRGAAEAIVRVRLLVLKVSKPNQNVIGGHNITKLFG